MAMLISISAYDVTFFLLPLLRPLSNVYVTTNCSQVFESCPSGVRVARYLDSYCNAYFDAGAKIALRRLTYVDRPPALLCLNQRD